MLYGVMSCVIASFCDKLAGFFFFPVVKATSLLASSAWCVIQAGNGKCHFLSKTPHSLGEDKIEKFSLASLSYLFFYYVSEMCPSRKVL